MASAGRDRHVLGRGWPPVKAGDVDGASPCRRRLLERQLGRMPDDCCSPILARGRLPLSARHLVFYLSCGLFGRALPSSLSYAAFAHLPVGVVVMIIATTPMLTFLIALTIRIETIDIRRLIGLGLGNGGGDADRAAGDQPAFAGTSSLDRPTGGRVIFAMRAKASSSPKPDRPAAMR